MRLLLIALGILYSTITYCQDSTLIVNLATTVSGSTSATPFWMYANKNGSVPVDKAYASGVWGLYKQYNTNNPRFLQFSAGAELVTNYGYKNKGDIFFTDLFVAAKFGKVEFMAGQKKHIVSLIDSTLGTGSLSVSGNSRPFPKIQISIKDFFPIAFTNDVLSVKFAISEGRLGTTQINYGSVREIPTAYFHQKQLYFRIGKSSSKLKGYFGINHQAVWGGEKQIWPVDNATLAKSYWRVFTGKSDNYRKTGTHFGTIDLALDFKIQKSSVFVYRNNIYDSGSLFKIINLSDGLNGIRIVTNNVKNSTTSLFSLHAVNFEYLSLNSQKNQFQPSGLVIYEIADYYNSYIYKRGLSYYGASIGSPLVPSKSVTNENLPGNSTQFTNNNRVQAFHTALQGHVLGIPMILKGTYSRNSGTYLAPFETVKNQWSFFLSGEKKVSFLNGTTITAGVAYDLGKLYPTSAGIFLGLKKSAFLN